MNLLSNQAIKLQEGLAAIRCSRYFYKSVSICVLTIALCYMVIFQYLNGKISRLFKISTWMSEYKKKDDLHHLGNLTNHLRHESSHPGFFFKNLISYFGIWSAGYWSTLDNLADELMETFRNSLTLSISFVHLQNIWHNMEITSCNWI